MISPNPTKIKSLAPWFGGKRALAPIIVRQLGPHRNYLEPYCGSMAVLFTKTPSPLETVNDLHGDLINLAQMVRSDVGARRLYDLLDRTLFCQGLIDDANQFFKASPEPAPGEDGLAGMTFDERMERAYWYFLSSWMGRNGTSGTRQLNYQISVRWTESGGCSVIRWRNALDSLPAWHRRLQNVVIIRRDAAKCIKSIDDQSSTAIYVDPPYHLSGRSDHRYLYDMDGDEPHRMLRESLERFDHGRVVVSYYDCPFVRELYDGWTFIDVSCRKNLHQQNKRIWPTREITAPEVLIVNGPVIE